MRARKWPSRGAPKHTRIIGERSGVRCPSQKPTVTDAAYWAFARIDGGWRMELAGTSSLEKWATFAEALAGMKDGDTLAYHGIAGGRHRFATRRPFRLGHMSKKKCRIHRPIQTW
jgi:hypothetical protein